MSSNVPAPSEDPLTAALPPVTDYLTYLTILEYRLKPHNLSVLNGILNGDDGTLAKEIGWDLLRLVLPMLADVPVPAQACLESIARRGNPREVVVRVAEELEKLGRSDDADDDDNQADSDADEDELRTFSGEATRVHLGEMKLDGMPDVEQPHAQPSEKEQVQDEKAGVDTTALEALEFPALLMMLGAVHPRIKTQYPSRFLATSLPAALAAYRRMPVTYESTIAFLECLEKLGGKQRPALPPRASTADTGTHHPTDTPLPDPEAPAEAMEGTNIASQTEKDIMARLLQAVMLEILDEYTSSLAGHEISSMLWTKRLREQIGNDTVPMKVTATQLFKAGPLKERDDIMTRALSLSQTLGLDARAEVTRSAKQDEQSPANREADEEEPSEYPASPSQIPFPPNAALLLIAARNLSDVKSPPLLDTDEVIGLFKQLTPLSETPRLPNPVVQDALHCMLYAAHCSQPKMLSLETDSSIYKELMSMLTQSFTITPNPQSRDDAHFIATLLLREREDAQDRTDIIKQTLRCAVPTEAAVEPIPLATPFTEGVLKAVGVNWLKTSILAHITSSKSSSEDHIGISPSQLATDHELSELVWHPSIPSPTHTHLLSNVLMALPYYIALLNLSHVLLAHLPHEHDIVVKNAKGLLQALEPWRDDLVGQLSTSEAAKASSSDIYSFEDAAKRVANAIPTTGAEPGTPG
ncbi:uncharacterized protein HMPREF1541_03950 [Cyphellophora europaea CBS 101466]|uniref:DUF1760-domain-containing protein n=1 Tax=Cyphellophora europaea (strain CBS 101466) TaxID=1220924 RepID=W2RZV7_CYPE1|nr:uncharacterized protein HMPREF1541_03950 [Cyphellophora europaea CBS 101466]ETN42011.1 hypothetical protein HMPREF1541_03950 [Cyphellophora europaea CBS 101466]